VTRLLLDEMLGPRIASGLRGRGVDARAVAEDRELLSLPDELVLIAAAAEGRALVTLNVADFVGLHRAWHAAGRSHAGILLVPAAAFRQDRSLVGALVTSLVAARDLGLLPGPDQVTFLRRA